MRDIFNIQIRTSNQCTVLLYALVICMVFEGILRKLLPPLSVPIFFFKDIFCIICLLIINRLSFLDVIGKLKSIWFILFLLILPLFFLTAFKDFILAFFALKQYLLFVVIGITVAVSFPHFKENRFKEFIFFSALLLIPTTMVAILQNALPASHWLNLSVGGGTLDAFSAAGYLRVGSTFSFTAQYSWFLNAESFFLATSFFLQPDFKSLQLRRYRPVIYLLLAFMLVIGAFITGGRTAVVGCGGTLALGLIFIGIKRPGWLFSKGVAILFLCIIGLSVLRTVKPEFFKAYDSRSSGSETTTHSEEVTGRVLGSFTNWADWFWEQDAVSVLLGNGLGIMSNGADQVSSYARAIRDAGIWPESDFPTTVWEGGLYLVVIWYGFRLTLILLCFRIWRWLKTGTLASAASVPFAYVFIHGLVDPFGMQPPLTIWWWFAIGIIICIYGIEKHRMASVSRKQTSQL